MNTIEIEKDILGCLLVDCKLYAEVEKKIKSESFTKKYHQVLFEKMGKQYNDDNYFDLISLETEPTKLEYLMNISDIISTSIITQRIEMLTRLHKLKELKAGVNKTIENIKIFEDQGEKDLKKLKSDIITNFDIEVKEEQEKDRSLKNGIELFYEDLERKLQGEERGDQYKWQNMNNMTAGIRSELSFIGAGTGVGKTAFVLNIANELINKGKNVCLFSLEMPKIQLTRRLISINTGIDQNKYMKPETLTDEDYQKINAYMGIVGNNCDVYDNMNNFESIVLTCKEKKSEGKLDMVIIDYLQLMETSKNVSLREQIIYYTRTLKKLQMELDIPIFVLSQLKRAESGKFNKMPHLSDLKESSSIEQDADNVFFLYDADAGTQQEGQNVCKTIEVIAAKQRMAEKDVSCFMKFYGTTQRFYQS